MTTAVSWVHVCVCVCASQDVKPGFELSVSRDAMYMRIEQQYYNPDVLKVKI